MSFLSTLAESPRLKSAETLQSQSSMLPGTRRQLQVRKTPTGYYQSPDTELNGNPYNSPGITYLASGSLGPSLEADMAKL